MDIKLGKYKPTKEGKSFKDMLLLRRFEEKCGQLYGMGEIGGFCHLYIGQEAVISAVDMVKQKDDSTITSYRDHAHIILAGTEPKYVLAELMGRATGCSKHVYGGHSIVGAQVPIGTGLAFAEKYNDTHNICFTFLGDGAVNQGQVYEAFNMDALWGLLVVYIIENNEYSLGTSVARSTFMRDLYKKGESWIKGFQLDGMDFEEMYDGSKQAAEYVRENSFPLILEVKTYRYRGHSMSDPAKYRSKEEVEQYKERDPLVIIRKTILDNKYVTEADLKEIEQSVKEIVKEAVEFSENSPLPDEGECIHRCAVKASLRGKTKF